MGCLPVLIQCILSNVTADLTTTSKIVATAMAAKTRHQPQTKIPYAPATRERNPTKCDKNENITGIKINENCTNFTPHIYL